MIHSDRLMKYKILGTALVLAGLLFIAKLDRNLIGLVLLFVGFYLALKKGMKPK
jgi:hypothetical protein